MPTSDAAPAPFRSRGRWVVRLALGAVVTAGCLAVLLSQIDAEGVAEVAGRTDWRWVTGGGGLYATLVVVRAFRYRLIAPQVPLSTLVAVHAVHALLLRVMPLRTGELGFAWLMRRAGAAGFSRSLVGLLMLRVLDFAAMLVLFAVGLVVFGSSSFARGEVQVLPWVILGVVALAAPLYLRWLLRVTMRMVDLVFAVSRLERLEPLERLRRKFADAVGWAQTVSTSTLFRATGWTGLQWAVNYLIFYVLLAAMHVEVTFAQTVLGGTGSAIGTLLPLAGVGSFGTLETGWALGFAAVGVPTALAVTSALGFSLITVCYSVVSGLLGWLALAGAGRRATKTTSDAT